MWDLDGTLADTANDIAWALDSLFREQGLPTIGAAKVRGLIGNGIAHLVRQGFSVQGVELEASMLTAMQDRFMEIYGAHPAGDTHLYPGIASALDRIHDAGISQAVCTNKSAAISESILDALGVRRFFTCVTGGDSTERRKPAALPLEVTADRLKCRVGDGIMIGDSAADSGAARSAGMPVAIVDYGYSRVPLASIDCDFRVTDVDAFASHVASFAGTRTSISGLPNAWQNQT